MAKIETKNPREIEEDGKPGGGNPRQSSTNTSKKPAEQKKPAYGELENVTSQMTQGDSFRASLGYKDNETNRVKENLLVVYTYPNQTCKIGLRDKTIDGKVTAQYNINQPITNGGNVPTPTGIKCSSNEMSVVAWNMSTDTILDIFDTQTTSKQLSKELEAKTKEAEEAKKRQVISDEEFKNLTYFTDKLGINFNDYNVVNNASANIKSYMDDYSATTIYFGYFKSAIGAKYKILKEKSDRLGGLNTEEQNLLTGMQEFFDRIKDNQTINPAGKNLERYLKEPLNTMGTPFENLDSKQTFYYPRGVKIGKKAADEAQTQGAQIFESNKINVRTCLEAFQAYACNMGKYNNTLQRYCNDSYLKKLNPTLAAKIGEYSASEDRLPDSVNIQVKQRLANCYMSNMFSGQGAGDVTGGTKPRTFLYLKDIGKTFFANGGVFRDASNACIFINVSDPYKQTGCPQTESNLKKNINKLLVEAKERKKFEILENDIVEDKLFMILESAGNNQRQGLKKISNEVISEVKKFNSKRYNKQIVKENLDNLFALLTTLYKDELDVKITFVENIVKQVLAKIGFDVSDETAQEIINNVVKTTEVEDLPKLLTNCNSLSIKIAESLPKAFGKKLSAIQGSNEMLTKIGSQMFDKLQDDSIVKELVAMISPSVCEALSDADKRAKSKIESISDNII